MGEQQINLLLVGEVEKHPILYNFNLPGYSRKHETEKAWAEVVLFAVLHCLACDVLEVTSAMVTLLEVKGIASLALVAGSFLIGLTPKWLGFATPGAVQLQYSIWLSAVLCFGAGVLLSTAIVHILGDVVAAIGVWGQVVFCAGFLTLYFVDELVQFWCLCKLQCERHEHSGNDDSREEESLIQHRHDSGANYGSADDCERLAKERRSKSEANVERDVTHKKQVSLSSHLDAHVEAFPGRDQIKLKNRSVKRLGLMFAFCIHSVLEGLAVGLQPTTTKVLLLLAAISCHKLVVTFCLGAELLSDNTSYASYIASLSLYSIASGLGIAIGMFIQPSELPVIPVLQGLAGGSLLYITVGEILPRERHHKTHCPMPKPTGLLQWFTVVCGFVLITCITIYTSVE